MQQQVYDKLLFYQKDHYYEKLFEVLTDHEPSKDVRLIEFLEVMIQWLKES